MPRKTKSAKDKEVVETERERGRAKGEKEIVEEKTIQLPTLVAFILSLIGGILIAIEGLLIVVLASMLGGEFSGVPGVGAVLAMIALLGVVGVLCGIMIMVGARLAYKGKQPLGGILIIIFSAVSILVGGGWIAGLILGIIGGILGLIYKPTRAPTTILEDLLPKNIFAKSKTMAKGVTSKVPAMKSKKVVALIIIFIIIVAAIASFAAYYPGIAGGGQGPSGLPTNETKPQSHAPYHKEYDTPAMNGFTPGGVGVYWYHEQKFPVDANATKLTAKLTVTSKIGPRLEINYIIKDAKGKELKKIQITSDSGGSIDISNTTLNSSGPGQYTSRVEVWKGIQVVSHIVIDVSYPDVNATKPQ